MGEKLLVSWRRVEGEKARVAYGLVLLLMSAGLVTFCLSIYVDPSTEDPAMRLAGYMFASFLLVTGLDFLFKSLQDMVNRIEVRLDNGDIIVQELPLRGSMRRVTLAEVSQFSSEAYQVRQGESVYTHYRLTARLINRDSISLIERIEQKRAHDLVERLNNLLSHARKRDGREVLNQAFGNTLASVQEIRYTLPSSKSWKCNPLVELLQITRSPTSAKAPSLSPSVPPHMQGADEVP